MSLLRLFVASTLFLATSCAAAAAAPRHYINDYAYLIGSWNCSEHLNGKVTPFHTSFNWMFTDRNVIEQRIVAGSSEAMFALTYNTAHDDFRGVYILSSRRGAQVGSWINPGPGASGWSEHGYDLDATGFPRISESVFTHVTPRHYEVTDFDLGSGKRTQTDTEICDKL